MFEEVVTQGESVAMPVKGVEGSRSTLPASGISRCVGATFRWYRLISFFPSLFSFIFEDPT